MTTQGQNPASADLLLSQSTELKLKLEEQARLLEHSRRLQHETDALEIHAKTWAKDQLKIVKANDERFNDLTDQLNELKANPEFVAANEALKAIKEQIGLRDVEKERNLRSRELTLLVNQSADALELQSLILEKTQELLDTMLQLDATNAYVRTSGLTFLEAASSQLPLV